MLAEPVNTDDGVGGDDDDEAEVEPVEEGTKVERDSMLARGGKLEKTQRFSISRRARSSLGSRRTHLVKQEARRQQQEDRLGQVDPREVVFVDDDDERDEEEDKVDEFDGVPVEGYLEPRVVHPAGVAGVVQVDAVVAVFLTTRLTVPHPLGLVRVREQGSLAGEREMVHDLARVDEADHSLEERCREKV